MHLTNQRKENNNEKKVTGYWLYEQDKWVLNSTAVHQIQLFSCSDSHVKAKKLRKLLLILLNWIQERLQLGPDPVNSKLLEQYKCSGSWFDS